MKFELIWFKNDNSRAIFSVSREIKKEAFVGITGVAKTPTRLKVILEQNVT